MNKKKLSYSVFIFLCSFCFAEADLSGIDIQGSIKKVNSGFNSFAKEIRSSVPNTMAGQNIYADSYIGNFVSDDYHFSAGLNFSIACLDSSELSSTFKTMSSLFKVIGHDINMNVPSTMPAPAVTLDGRIGGFYLPVDLGIVFTAISSDAFKIDPEDSSTFDSISSPLKFNRGDFNGKYTIFSFGLNGRYSIVRDDEKLPDISAGIGYYCSKGALNMKTTDVNENGTLDVNIGHSFLTQVIAIESQASKKYGIWTPFAGCKLLWIASENAWVRKVYLDGMYMPMSGTNCIKRGFSEFYIEPQIFAGTGISLGPVQWTINAAFDIRNVNVSGGFSIRYKK